MEEGSNPLHCPEGPATPEEIRGVNFDGHLAECLSHISVPNRIFERYFLLPVLYISCLLCYGLSKVRTSRLRGA